MAQMAPALAEAAGSPNADISSSTVHKPLRTTKLGEEIKKDHSRLHIHAGSLNHNGIYRSVANNSKTTTTVSCVMEKVHRMQNKLPYTSQKSHESTVLAKSNAPKLCAPTAVENAKDREETRSVLPQNEALRSTPTRIPITTTRTCASNSPQNLSSCAGSGNETNKKVEERHSVACLDSTPQILFNEKVKKIGYNQARLIRRARILERKIRALQSRHLESHVGEQLACLSEKRKNLKTKQSEDTSASTGSNVRTNSETPSSGELMPKEESSNDKGQQQEEEQKQDSLLLRNDGSTLNRENLLEQERTSTTETKVDEKVVLQDERDVARSLVCQLELVETVADSDATLSSSGGESCDEMDEEDITTDDVLRSNDCASQFYSERGSIASKWAWLRSQVIDIERRIRRCEETYKSVRTRKRPVQLEKQKFASMVNRSADDLLIDTVNMMTNRKESYNISRNGSPVQLSTNPILLPDVSSKDKSIINNGKNNVHLMNDHLCTAARTRPLQCWQKRKLFSLSQLQKPIQNVFCCCSSPLTPCVLCQKKSQTLPVLKSTQDTRDRVSLLDLSFHPVLSFETDVPLSFHFGALLRKGNFQSKIFKLNPPKGPNDRVKRKYVRSASSPAALKKRQKASLDPTYKKPGIRALRSRKNSTSLPNTPKTKRTPVPRLCKTEAKQKKRPAAVSAGFRLASQLQKRARSLSLPESDSRPSSPVSGLSPTSLLGQPLQASALLSAKKKKLTSNAYDINNIVIPYSMASTTRVEKLKYKEIMTPGWRELSVSADNTNENQEEEKDGEEIEEEDTSNLTFALRHMKCEEQERKRFHGMAIKKKKRAMRQSSEVTTPEPISPGSIRLLDVSACQTSSGVPSPSSSNAPSLNSSLNLTSPTGLTSMHHVVNMLPYDNLLPLVERCGKGKGKGKSEKHGRRSLSTEQSEDSNESWPIVITPWCLREFPLSEKEVEDLTNLNPPPPPPPSPFIPSIPPSPSSSTSRANSPILSPIGSPDNLVNANWTVKVLTPEAEENLEADAKPQRKGIVLKLAKR